MKLHLTQSLRNALLATFAVMAPLATTAFTGVLTVGACSYVLSEQAQAASKDITFDGSQDVIPWVSGYVGEYPYRPGDNIVFSVDPLTPPYDEDDLKSQDIEVRLDNVEVEGVYVQVNENTRVILSVADATQPHTISKSTFKIYGTLALKDNTILGAASKILGWQHSTVEVDWGMVPTGLNEHEVSNWQSKTGWFEPRFNDKREYSVPTTDFQGVVRVLDSYFYVGSSKQSAIQVHGESVLDFGSGTNFSNFGVNSVGRNVFNVATNPNSTAQGNGVQVIGGQLAGNGQIIKQGDGRLIFNHSELFFSGDIIVEEGSVRWVATTPMVSTRSMNLHSIQVVKAGASFEDTFTDVNMRWGTDVFLTNGGALLAYDADRSHTQDWLLVPTNYFQTLTIAGQGVLDLEVMRDNVGTHTFDAGRRFERLVADSSFFTEHEILFANNTAAAKTFVEFDYVDDFNGTISPSGVAPVANCRVYLNEVNINKNHRFAVDGNLGTYARQNLTKTGEGMLYLDGALTVKDDLFMQEGILQVNGSVQVPVVLRQFTNNRSRGNYGVMMRNGVFSVGTSTTIEGNVMAETMLLMPNVQEGETAKLAAITVNSNLLVHDWVTMQGGSLYINGNVNNAKPSFNSNLRTATTRFMIGGDATMEVRGELPANTTREGVFHAAALEVSGNANVSINTKHADELVDDPTAGSDDWAAQLGILRKTGDGTLTVTGMTTITRELGMQYSGSILMNGHEISEDSSGLKLGSRVLLTYDPAMGENLIQLNSHSLSDISGDGRLYVDVSAYKPADPNEEVLINLGILSSSLEFYRPRLRFGNQLESYELIKRGGYVYLKAKGFKDTTWDTAWDVKEKLSYGEYAFDPNGEGGESRVTIYGPEENLPVREVKGWATGRIPSSTTDGLSAAFYKDTNVLAISAKGVDSKPELRNYLVGGYGIYPNNGVMSGDVQTETWLKASGTFEIVVGGSTNSVSNGGAQMADTHIVIENGAKIGTVVGGNVQLVGASGTDFTGDNYISVYSNTVMGSVIGRNSGEGKQTGDSHIFIYTPLTKNDEVKIDNKATVDASLPALAWYSDDHAVIGASYRATSSMLTWMYGNTDITIDFSTSTKGNAKFQKTVTAGFFGTELHAQEGVSKIRVHDTSAVTFGGAIVGGSYHDKIEISHNVGNKHVEIYNVGGTFSRPIVGGDYSDSYIWAYYTNDDEHATYRSFDKKGSYIQGDVSISIASAEKATFSDKIILCDGLDHAEGASDGNHIRLEVDGDSYFYVDSGKFTDLVVGAHYVYDNDKSDEAKGNYNANVILTGTAYMDIRGGVFRQVVEGGTYFHAQNYGSGLGQTQGFHSSSAIIEQGGVVMNIGGLVDGDENRRKIVFGKEGVNDDMAILGGYDLEDLHLEKSDIPDNMGWNNWVYAHIGDIELNFLSDNIYVHGEIIGGSRNRGNNNIKHSAGIAYDYAVEQGAVTLNLAHGHFYGDIYAAGFWDGDGGYEHFTGPICTGGIEVKVGSKVEFGKDVMVSGGYKYAVSPSYITSNPCVINGRKVLNFMDPVTYTNLNGGVQFTYFNEINVVKNADVMLNQLLQVLCPGNLGIKTGEGTLRLASTKQPISSSSELDTFNVEEGKLVLPFQSDPYRDGIILETLAVNSQAKLDISAGSCGVRGTVMLAGESTLIVNPNQLPTVADRLIWGDFRGQENLDSADNAELTTDHAEGKVMIDLTQQLTPAQIANGFTIRLFKGLSKDLISGIDLKTLTSLALEDEGEFGGAGVLNGIKSDAEVVYAARAEKYMQMKYGDTPIYVGSAYFVLDSDGELYLTTHLLRSLYWEPSMSGATWSTATAVVNFASKDELGAEYFFVNDSRVVFTNDGDIAPQDPHVVNVEGTVAPRIMEVSNGLYVFSNEAGNDSEVKVTGSLNIGSEGSETAAVFDASTQLTGTPYVTLTSGSTLTVNNAESLSVSGISSEGQMLVNSDMVITGEVVKGGTLTVNGDLQLGGDSTFTNLAVAGHVTGNEGHTLHITKGVEDTDPGFASMESLDGGTLWLDGATVQARIIAPEPEVATLAARVATGTELTSLQGTGTLTTNEALRLTEASHTGNLTTTELTVDRSLVVEGTLNATSITLTNVGPALIADGKVVTAGELDCGNVIVTEDAFRNAGLLDSGAYYLVLTDHLGVGTVLTVNGEQEQVFRANRYAYTATVFGAVGDVSGIQVVSTMDAPDYFQLGAKGENAIAGASSLDSMFQDGTIENISISGALAAVILQMNEHVENGNQAAASRLAAAAGGASYAAMGAAFSDDVQRQLKAIRNRTTTMGAGEEYAHDGLPAFNAWINAEGNHNQLSADGDLPGYKLNSWGGTVGFDVDFSGRFTAGMAVSAMYGKYTASSSDMCEGDLDTQYATVFLRYASQAWVHTLIGTVGRADVSVTRTVGVGNTSYGNKADSDGSAFGLMYEVGRVFAMNEDATTCIEPVINVSFSKTTISGFNETGSDAALSVEDLEMTKFVLGAGARIQSMVGTTVYNRSSILEGRALVKANLGDKQCEVDNKFRAGGIPGTYKSAEQGTVGVEVGVGLTVPVGGDGGSVFADFSADISSGYTNMNGTVGYRVSF